jgi:hypothetical protein
MNRCAAKFFCFWQAQQRFCADTQQRYTGKWTHEGGIMRQLVIDILLKMAKMDTEAKELVAQVEAQSLLLAALLIQAKEDNTLTITETVQDAIVTASRSGEQFLQSDVDLLLTHINRLLAVASYVEVKGIEREG